GGQDMTMTAAQLLAERRWVVRAYGASLVGGVVWIAALLLRLPNPLETDWAKVLFMLAPLVLLPLGLRLVAPQAVTEKPGRLRQIIAALQLPAAMLLGGAFLLPQGFLAAALAVPWLALTGLIALIGLGRIWQHGHGPLHELCMDAGLVYVAVG